MPLPAPRCSLQPRRSRPWTSSCRLAAEPSFHPRSCHASVFRRSADSDTQESSECRRTWSVSSPSSLCPAAACCSSTCHRWSLPLEDATSLLSSGRCPTPSNLSDSRPPPLWLVPLARPPSHGQMRESQAARASAVSGAAPGMDSSG